MPSITNFTDPKFRPLKKWIENGNIIPSREAYRKFDTASFNVSTVRKQSAIFDIIYRCRFVKYPTTWDYTFQRLECFIEGEEPIIRREEYLPDLTLQELQTIREELAIDLKTHYGIDMPTMQSTDQLQTSSPQLSESSALYEDTPLVRKSTRRAGRVSE